MGENKEKNKPKEVAIKYENINKIYNTLVDAYRVIQAKYPGANHAERKGMKLMMDEINEAEEMCLEVIRPELNPE